MKLLTCFATLLLCLNCMAQTANENSFNQIAETTAGQLSESKISEATLKSFNRQFKNISNTVWNTSTEGSSVKFILDGVGHQVFYNKKGRWISTIKYIPVDLLPRYVVGRISQEYPEHKIFFAQSVRTAVGHAYVASIENGTAWKQIKLVDNDIEVMGDYVRN